MYAVLAHKHLSPAAARYLLFYLYFVFSLAERKNEIQKKIKYRCESSHLDYRLRPVHKEKIMTTKLPFSITGDRYPSRRSVGMSRHGMVGASQPLAAQTGLRILLAGGNAADAAVAVAATLNV